MNAPSRRRYRLFGLLPILQWAQSLNDPATAPEDGQIRLIERLQVWSMILYYPLEHWCTSLAISLEVGVRAAMLLPPATLLSEEDSLEAHWTRCEDWADSAFDVLNEQTTSRARVCSG